MFQSITFYVGEKTLGIYGEEFPLGALTTEILNITPAEYQALDGRLKSAIEGMALYEKTHNLTDWHQANEQMLLLNEALCHHRIFRLIQTDAYILTEAKQHRVIRLKWMRTTTRFYVRSVHMKTTWKIRRNTAESKIRRN